MKVARVMQRQIISVAPTTKLREVGKIIFGLRIAGIPVAKGKKFLGLITQTDILHRLYPSYQEFMEDYVHAKDFEAMEKFAGRLLDLPASAIMNKSVTTVSPDTPVMQVQSLMLTRHFGRVPVVDKRNNLLGIVSQGDIFRVIVGGELPMDSEESFYDQMAGYYDLLIDWKKRLRTEVASLASLLLGRHVKRVIDIGASTGEHSIGLAQKGFQVVGLEASSLMSRAAQIKRKKLPASVRTRLTFLRGEYKKLVATLPADFDCAIFMGNALSHGLYSNAGIIDQVAKKLHPARALMIFQLGNFDRACKLHHGFRDFSVRRSPAAYGHEHAFLTFYAKEKRRKLSYNVTILDKSGDKWVVGGMHSTPIVPIGPKEITVLVKKAGFSKITLYGSMFNGPLFAQRFDKDKHDWLNVVAVKK